MRGGSVFSKPLKNYCTRLCGVEVSLKMLMYYSYTPLSRLTSPCLAVARYVFKRFVAVFCLTLLLVAGLASARGIDPTQPPANLLPAEGEAAQSEAMPRLQSVLRGARGSRAVIDGQNLKVGDEYAGVRVLAIYPQAVLIERREQRQLLRLAEPVLQPSR